MLRLIPYPKECKVIDKNRTSLVTTIKTDNPEWRGHIGAFIDAIYNVYEFTFEEGNGGIELIRDESLPANSYRIKVDEEAKIYASASEGACYSLATLLQLVAPGEKGIVLPRVEIFDYPDKDYRSIMVDLGREWHPFSKLLKYVDLCFFYKVRYLNLHFADNKLYTLPSRAFPKLSAEGKYYTEEQISYLCEYARLRGVVIVPEFECPGHAPVLNTHYPEVFSDRGIGEGGAFYNEFGEQISSKALLCATSESSVEGVKTLLREICELFPDTPYIHIGGDEANISLWDQCASCRAYMEKNHIADVYGLYSDYVARIAEYVLSLGKTPIVWEGFPEKGADKIPKETVVISWENHYQTTGQLLAEGFPIINASWKPLYIVPASNAPIPIFDWGAREIFEWNVYNWQHWWTESEATKNPINIKPTDRVLGAMLCAWEMTFEEEISFVMSSLAALSERTWTVEQTHSFDDFRTAFSHTYYVSGKIIQDR
ncbi:MAG: family 20 glycosylhydrolase [Clostridia bacterium]|nr:family 20 glycosylhydrolase [Clostridia bacterium]